MHDLAETEREIGDEVNCSTGHHLGGWDIMSPDRILAGGDLTWQGSFHRYLHIAHPRGEARAPRRDKLE